MLPIPSTKLHAPRLHPAGIRRQRLLERLDAGLNAGHRLTLVEAPAGYGKSTLLTTWLHEAGRPFAWVSLDEGDNDLSRFLASLIASLRRIGGEGFGQATESLLQVPQPIPPEALAAYLISDLEGVTEPHILVLDDYHVIEAQPVHRAVQTLLDQRPPALHLVLASRADPPLSVARWRARGEVSEIRAGELRFTTDEAGAFLRQTMRVDLPPAAIAVLESRTEGWAAGLQLAGLSLQGRDPAAVQAFVEGFSGSHRYIIDYLAEDVLRGLEPAVRDFLCRTAVLDRLSAPLCEAVTGRPDSRSLLANLEQSNLFLVPLDDHRVWYRYHHLFRDVLGSELSDGEKRPLHRRAAVWLEAHDLPGDAVRHYLAAGEPGAAAQVVRQATDRLLEAGEVRTLLGWMTALPEAEFTRDPELMIYRLWALFSAGQMADAARQLGGALAAMPGEISPRLRGRLLCIQAWIGGFTGDPKANQLGEAAMQIVTEEDPVCRCATLLVYGNLQSTRPGVAALDRHRHYREAYELARRHNQPFMAMTALMDLAIVLNAYGHRREAESLCAEGVRLYTDHAGRPLPVTGMVLIQLGILLYDAGRVSEARDLVNDGLEMSRRIGFELHVLCDAAIPLARIALAEGDVDAALATLHQAREMAERLGVPNATRDATSLEIDILIRQGQLEPVARWAESRAGAPPQAPGHDPADLTLVRFYRAAGRVEEASSLLERLEAEARSEGYIRRLISLLILRALVTGDSAHLADAVQLAAPEEYVRLFQDEGPDAATLLSRVRAAHPAFVDRLTGMTPDTGSVSLPFGEHLTEREVELLLLLAAGLTNEEIAAKLFISLTTTKWHVRNVLSKLGVNNRTQAAARARELGLL